MTSLSFGFTEFDPSPEEPEGMKARAEAILGAIQFAGYAIALGMLIYVGIKYVMSSANERADVKQASINYLIGAIIIAGAPTLFKIIYEFMVSAKQ